jgi:uncharacterized protein (TIGR00290 family)
VENVLVSWSGGKDGAVALYEILRSEQYRVAALLTTVTQDYDRISMHGVRRCLLEAQAAALNLPLEIVWISVRAADREYESKMADSLRRYQQQGVTSVVFGDLFLEDLKVYRETNLAKLGMRGIFPLWKRDTRELAQSLAPLGFRAVTTCVDTQQLDSRFVGRNIDASFLAELPDTVDPCGENGEFHSFVSDGPIFKNRIPYTLGEKVLRDNRFFYCDLAPEAAAPKNHNAPHAVSASHT